MPYKQGNRWRGAVWKNGKRVKQKLFDLKRDAVEWEREQKARLNKTGIDTDFLTLYNRYLDNVEKRMSGKTYDEKKSALDRFNKYLGGNRSVDMIGADDAEEHLLEQADLRSNNASNKDRKNLIACWNYGIKILGLESNPFAICDKLAHDRQPQYTPPEEDVLKVLATTIGHDRVFLQCYMNTAARRSEIMRLTWPDINFDKSEIRLWSRKNRSGTLESVWLPMNDDLRAALWWQWNNRPFKNKPHVFIDTQKGPHYGQPYKIRRRFLKGRCKVAGVKPFGFHALRRWVAQMLADKHKQSTQTVQRVLRHKNVRTTEIYLENLNADLRPAMSLLDKNSDSPPQYHPKKESGGTD